MKKVYSQDRFFSTLLCPCGSSICTETGLPVSAALERADFHAKDRSRQHVTGEKKPQHPCRRNIQQYRDRSVSIEAGLGQGYIEPRDLVWTDADSDGFLDILIVAGEGVHLMMNGPSLVFSNEAGMRGLPWDVTGFRQADAFDGPCPGLSPRSREAPVRPRGPRAGQHVRPVALRDPAGGAGRPAEHALHRDRRHVAHPNFSRVRTG